MLQKQFMRLFLIHFWGNLPALVQKFISQLHTQFYNLSISKHLIPLYCKVHYKDPKYLQQFAPGGKAQEFRNFQDFFTRKFKKIQLHHTPYVWPCEGFLCEYGQVSNLPLSNVKGDKRAIDTIFNSPHIPTDYFYSNVFLHNKNYHRIHSPLLGKITRIKRIPGNLYLLRPWFYKNNPSFPAIKNERVVVDIQDMHGATWYLSIVGGPAVGSIKMHPAIEVGTHVAKGTEIATFLLGSTCCIAAPVALSCNSTGDCVQMGHAW